MHNLLIGGAAGDGIETTSNILERILKKSGCYVFTMRDAMSRIRGGHNFMQLRFGAEPISAHRKMLDGILAINEETFELHKEDLLPNGFILCDVSLKIHDERTIKINLKEKAKELGNPKISSIIALGALLKLFGKPLEHGEKIIFDSMKTELAQINLAGLKAGYEMVETRYMPNPTNLDNHILISGNKALALGAIAGNLKFYSAYPMSPSTAILEYLSKHGDKFNIAVEQAEDEIAAINMALGASYGGAGAMVATSGGGFSLMVEALGFSGIAELPVVIVNIQRPGPATGFPTRTEQSDLRFVISASQGEFPRMVIAIKHHSDAFYQASRALAIASKYQIPVILLSDQYIADSTTTIPTLDTKSIYKNTYTTEILTTNENPYGRYAFTKSGISPSFVPGKSPYLVRIDSDEHDEYGQITESATMRKQMVEKRMKKLVTLEAELIQPDFLGDMDFETLLVGFGSTYGVISEAVTLLNAENKQKYGALVFGDVWPLPTKLLKKYAPKAKRIINIEQNATGQLASLLKEVALISCDKSILKYDGRQLSVDDILDSIKK